MSTATASTPLDFAALLSRNHQPARVTRLVPQEAYKVSEKSDKLEKKDSRYHEHGANAKPSHAGDVEASKLAMQLVSKTPAYIRHIESSPTSTLQDGGGNLPKPPVDEWASLSAALHEVQLGDWEKNIMWEGAKEEVDSKPRVDASSLLAQRRNPHLEALVFDNSNISWDGSPSDTMEKARQIPLILEMGMAGQSIARHVLPVSRPTPFGQSNAYMQRYEREWSTPATSSADIAKGSLHADRDQMEAIIEARQKKRAQMAKDKSTRVTEAMGTLALGGGKGRTITSSLMGPGGTERTGRPSRNAGSSSTHDVEYIEQLELVYSHALVKPDLRKVELRQYHRPRLPLSVVRAERPWQFQIRFVASSKKADANANASSYQSMMMGSHAGALSQAKIRNEADLSPTEGKLVLLEYCEERPPIQLTKGMASKVINYYRGDKSRCPVSAGGGDRPTRRKRRDNAANEKEAGASTKVDRPPRLIGPNQSASTTVTDWIGNPPKKNREERTEKPSIDILPEGVTEILYHKVHGPFIGEVEDGLTQTGLISNLFVAPMFRHEPESTDFLMILGKKPSTGSRLGGPPQSLGVVLRPLPSSIFTVGQTEPRTRVHAPNTTGERNFIAPFISYQIAKALTRMESKEGRGLRFDEINDRLFANTVLLPNALRQRIKQVAIYDKNTQIWTSKPIGMEEYPGVEALGRRFSPEGVAAYETACAAARRLCDIGIHELFSGTSNVASIGVAMVYLAGQVNAAREISRKMRKMLEFSKTSKNNKTGQLALYEKAAWQLETAWKEARRKHEVARFIYEELQLVPWHLTGEFIDVHKNAQGTGMMRLTGLGDPSGLGEGYNFLREADAKPVKGAPNNDGALNAQIKKITGTENDLRKLTMKQMASLLRSYGMGQKEIDTLKRWDRVHVIRDLSTKAASDGMGDGLERFARGEKMKLSEQKEMYRERIQEIWRRQRAALSIDAGDIRPPGPATAGATTSATDMDTTTAANEPLTPTKQIDNEKDDSDSDSDDDDLAAMLEEDMMDVRQTNQLVAAHVRGGADDGNDMHPSVGGLAQHRREDAQDLSKDARELAALKRQREEERAVQEGLLTGKIGRKDISLVSGHEQSMIGRKVIRKRITKTYPDGRQTTTFKFVVVREEVDKIIRKKQDEEPKLDRTKKKALDHKQDEKPIGHAMFEDEDDVDHRSRSGMKFQQHRATRTIKSKKSGLIKTLPKAQKSPKLHLGKLKQKVSAEKRIKKRKREAEEADLYVTASKRKGTSNRRERGSARERMPHVILADKLESIRASVEKKPGSGPFHRPVNRRALPRYYEVISNPTDLQTIRDKNQRYEYKTAEAFLRDFDLMKNNAIKFNGVGSVLGDEASSIYDFVNSEIEENRTQLDVMEEAVREQLSGKQKKKSKTSSKSKSSSSYHAGNAGGSGSNVVVDGIAVNLGELSRDFQFDGADTDSDDSYTGLLQGKI